MYRTGQLQLSHLNSNLRVVAGSFRAAPQGNWGTTWH